LRRSTRLSTIPQTISKIIEYIDLEGNEPIENEPIENDPIENEPTEEEPVENPGISPKGSPRSSPRVSPQPYSSPLRSLVHSPSIDPIQQEIYDYIESLERQEASTKVIVQSPREGSTGK